MVLRMEPRSEDRALTALLRALLTVRFFMSGVFLVNQRQRGPRGMVESQLGSV